MGKPNAQVLLIQAQKEIRRLQQEIWIAKGFTMQQCLDIAQITLHEEFGFGPVYQKRFAQAFKNLIVDSAELCKTDGKDDQEIVYTKAVIDRKLSAACGEIKPFDERYALENLYFWDNREEWRRSNKEPVEGGGSDG